MSTGRAEWMAVADGEGEDAVVVERQEGGVEVLLKDGVEVDSWVEAGAVVVEVVHVMVGQDKVLVEELGGVGDSWVDTMQVGVGLRTV